MIQITPQMRVLVAVEAVDFRKGIDSLAQLCRNKLAADPFSGCVFVFRSRRSISGGALPGGWLRQLRRSRSWSTTYVEFSVMCSRPAHWRSGNGFCEGSTAH